MFFVCAATMLLAFASTGYGANAAPTPLPYASGNITNSRTVVFPISSFSSPTGTSSFERYTAYTTGRIRRLQQSIEFQAPVSSSNVSSMNVTVYVRYYVPTATDASGNRTVTIWLASPSTALTDPLQTVINRNPFSSALGDNAEPSLTRKQVLSCTLPSVATLGADVCPATPFLCGVASITYPTVAAQQLSPMGRTQLLIVSLSADVAYTKTTAQDTLCTHSVEVTGVWDDPSVQGVVFRTRVEYSSNETGVRPDLLIPTFSWRSEAQATSLVRSQFITGSDPVGTLWTPLLVDDKLRSFVPAGSYHSRFGLTNYSAASVALLSPIGATCTIDDGLMRPSHPDGAWTMDCILPIKNAVFGSLAIRMPDPINATYWVKGLTFTLESTANTTLAPRTIACRPTNLPTSLGVTRASCRMFTSCGANDIFFGSADGTNQQYTQLRVSWSPDATGFVQPIVADDESDGGVCNAALTFSLIYTATTTTATYAAASCRADQYECVVDKQCIANQQVCDGVDDCSDAADEEGCNKWSTIRGYGTFPPCPDAVIAGAQGFINTYLTCLKTAQANSALVGGLRYVVDDNYNGRCEYFHINCVRGLSASTIAYNYSATALPTVRTAVLVLQLEDTVRTQLVNDSCSSMYSCRSRGAASAVSVAALAPIGTGCVCDCYNGFQGARCEAVRPFSSMDGVWVEFSGSSTPATAALLRSIQVLLPDVGQIFLHVSYFDSSTTTTRMLLGVDEPSVLATSAATAALTAGLTTFLKTEMSSEEPIVLTTDVSHCTIDDSSRAALCTYFRKATTDNFDVIVSSLAPLATSTIEVSAFLEDGTRVAQRTCTVVEMQTQPDLSEAFIRQQRPQRTVESWCPASTTCLVGSLAGNVVAFQLDFVLPSGMNSTTLSVGCNGVTHFDDANILPKLVVLPPTPKPFELGFSTEDYAVVEGSSAASLALFAACLGITVISGLLWYFFRRRDDHLMDIARTSAESKIAMKRMGLQVGEKLTETLKWAIRVVAKAERGPDVKWYLLPRRQIALWVTATTLFGGIGLVALIYFLVTTQPKTSNYEAVLEFYRDGNCNASTLDANPYATYFTSASGECQSGTIIGKPFDALPPYFSAVCQPSATSRRIEAVTVVPGYGMKSQCNGAPLTIPTATCTSIPFVGTGLGYVMVRCEAISTLAALRNSLANRYPVTIYQAGDSVDVPLTQAAAEGVTSSSASEDDTLAGQRVPPFTNANPYTFTDPISGASMLKYYYVDPNTGSTRFSTSGTSVGYLLSTAVGDTTATFGPSTTPKELLVAQTPDTLLAVDVVTDIRAYEESIPDSARFLPRTAQTDVPIGRFFNGYGTYPATGVNATESSDHRMFERLYYPGIMGQDSDIGDEGEATIAFWLRAGRTSRGFPIASTDNARLSPSMTSPLLERLERMILSGNMNADNWYNDDWSVYWAVFIDGYSQRIYFVAAGPPQRERVGLLDSSVFFTVWDAGALGLSRIFTNRWHHVAIVMEIPSNVDESGVGVGLLLRLVVDGETYSGSQGFLKCLPRQLDYITPLWVADIPVPQDFRLTQGGALVVGNINAGLYGVLVTSVALAQPDIIALGTVPMNNFFNINSAQFFALGFYVTFMAVALLCMMAVGIGVEYVSERRKRIVGQATAADLAYMSIVGVNITAEKFKVGGRDFRLFPVDTVKAVLGLEDSIFATLLTEIEKLAVSGDGAKADLMAIVWIRAQETYVPSTPQFAAMRDQFCTSEKADLSHDGFFFIPSQLWNDMVEELTVFWEKKLDRREVDEDSLKKQAATGKKVQVKVAKVKVSKGGKSGSKGAKGGKGGRKGTSVRKLSNSVKVNAAAPMQMIQPVILALQSAGAYMVNFALPLEYQDIFENMFTFFTFRWLSFPELPDLFIVLFVFTVAIAVTAMLFFFCMSDHDEWLAFVGMYAAKRDGIDKAKIKLASEPPKTKSQRKQLLVALGDDDDLDDDELFSDNYRGISTSFEARKREASSSDDDDGDHGKNGKTMDEEVLTPRTMPVTRTNWFEPMLRHILPLSVTIPMDEFIDGSRRSNVINVHRKDLQPAPCPKKRMKWEMEYSTEHGAYVAYDGDNHDAPPLQLMDVGYLCPLHRSILCEMEQRDTCVKPYRCFGVANGNRCTCVEGQMYCCRSHMPGGKFCPYALCEVHFRSSATEFIKVSAKSGMMEIFGEGVSNFLAFVAISLSGVVYFPVVQTCLQFLVCDPQYQCLFPHCWDDADSSFILAVAVVMLMLAIVGAGMPIVLYWELHRRKKVLFAIFHRKEYFKVYLAVDEDAMEEMEEREKQAKESMFSTDRRDPTEAAGVFGFFAKFFSKAITGETIEEEVSEMACVVHKKTVDFGEWERFLAGDNSALGQILYKFIEYEYLTLPPFLMLYRVAILIPVVFITDNLFLQMTALSVVEIGFGTFIFWTEPYINPWIDTMYRAGSVHNIMLIGLAAINTMLRAEGSTVELGNLMLLVTGVYFVIVVFLLIMTTVWPTLAIALTKSNVAAQMKRIGMRTIDMSSVVLNPLMHKRALLPIVEVLQAYDQFTRAHPEAQPGDDINSVDDPDDRDDRDNLDGGNMMPVTKGQSGANAASDERAGGTVGNGLLGPLAGVPRPSREPTPNKGDSVALHVPGNDQSNERGSRHATPSSFMEQVVDAVAGSDSDDPEDDIQEGEFD